MEINRYFKSNRIQFIFMTAGAFGGFIYWKFIGCTSGTCVIKSVWYWMTLWGAAVGYLTGDFLNEFVKKKGKKEGMK